MPRASLAPLLAIAVAVGAASPAQADEPGEALDLERIRAHVRAITTIGPRPANSPAAAEAANYVEAQLARIGITVEKTRVGRIEHERIYVLGGEVVPAAQYTIDDLNLLARIPGGNPDAKAILVMGHYDSMPTTPGAVDNAVAMAILLELARVLTAHPPPRPVILAWTAAEEYRLSGATALARDIHQEVGLAISIDLLGWAPNVSLNGLSSMLGKDWLAWLARAARNTGVELRAPIPHRVVSRYLPQIERSDHGAFTARGIPAFHIFSRGPERIFLRYHSPYDTFDRVEWSAVSDGGRFLQEVIRTSESLPETGGEPGLWIDIPGGPWVLTIYVVAFLELLLLFVAIAGIVRLVRTRRRGGGIFKPGLLVFGPVYVAIWTLIAGVLAWSAHTTGHPAPWVHGSTQFYVLPILIATCLGVITAWAVTRWRPGAGLGRYLSAAIALPAAAGLGLAALGIFELAILPLWTAACLGAMAWTRRAATGIALLIAAALPLVYPLDPGLLREGVFNGIFPPQVPIALVLSVLCLPYALAAIYATKRWAPPFPTSPKRVALVVAIPLALIAVATVSLLRFEPPCTGPELESLGLYCEVE